MRIALQKLALRGRQIRFLLGEVRGMRARLSLLARTVASRLAPGPFARSRRLATARLPFRRFDLEFRVGEGEILSYEPIVRDLERGIIPSGPGIEGWTVVDCGANIGIVSLFLKEARRIIAIEPQPDACARLRRNLEANGVAATVVEKAVSEAPGMVRMDLSGIFSRVSEQGAVWVEATTLDAILDEHGVGSVDLLKLDVEGHLFEALRGARRALERGTIRRICAEFIGDAELSRLDAALTPRGFVRIRTSTTDALYAVRSSPCP